METTRPRSMSAHGPHPKKHDPILSKIISGTLHQKFVNDKKISSSISPSQSPSLLSPPSSPTPIKRRDSFRRCTVLIPSSLNNSNNDISSPVKTSPIVKPTFKSAHPGINSPKLSSSSSTSFSSLSSSSSTSSSSLLSPVSPPSSPPRSTNKSPRSSLIDSVKGSASSIKRAISCPVINSCVLLDSLLSQNNNNNIQSSNNNNNITISPLLPPPFHASPPLSPHQHTPSPRFASTNGMRTTPRVSDANHKVTWWGSTHIGSRQENQDCFMLPNDDSNKEFLFYGVFDGHGPEGKYASNCAKNTIQAFYEEHITTDDTRVNPNLMRTSFLNAHSAILGKAVNDFGTTAVVAGLHMPSSQLFFGWVGDSKVIICRKQKPNFLDTNANTNTNDKDNTNTNNNINNNNNDNGYYAVELTRDHVLSLPEEMDRVYASGGVIRNPGGTGRVFLPELYSSFYGVKVGGLNMSRALGHMYLSRFGVIPDPEFGEEGLQPEDFVVLATDGLWGRMTPSEVAKFIGEKSTRSPKELSLALIEEALSRWGTSADNITVVVLKTSHNT